MSDDQQDTGNIQEVGYKNPPKNTRFQKNDKRINRNGRPKSFDQLRKLAQRIAAEDISPAEAAEAITRVEAMLKTMSSSRNPADKALFLAYAYGKPKDEVDVTSGGKAIEQPKEDNARFDRAISTLADAIREIIPKSGDGQNSEVDTAK